MTILDSARVLWDSGLEQTELTPIARTEAKALVLDRIQGEAIQGEAIQGEAIQGEAIQVCLTPAGAPYALCLIGQSPVTGHGKQGMRLIVTRILRSLDERDIPVYVGICEGRGKWLQAWLRELPAARKVYGGEDGDPESPRYGWRCDEFPAPGPLEIPVGPPAEYRALAQTALI